MGNCRFAFSSPNVMLILVFFFVCWLIYTAYDLKRKKRNWVHAFSFLPFSLLVRVYYNARYHGKSYNDNFLFFLFAISDIKEYTFFSLS